jgi:non-specific serine/threonine protein kinase
MLRPDGYVKVLDFGLAKLVEADRVEADRRDASLTAEGAMLGTPLYMSPEQARGLPVDARTDLWSLGVVLYELAAGRPPFSGDTASDLIAAILLADPAPLPGDVPEELARILRRALRRPLDERYQTAGEMARDLERLARGAKPARGRAGPTEVNTSADALTLELAGGDGTAPEALARQTNLAGDARPLLGREAELRDITSELRRSEVRLLTLTGAGGTGKTELARAVGRELLDEFEGGVFFVDLSAVHGPAMVAPAIAQALGVREAGTASLADVLGRHLRDERALLVLDNFEQVLDAAPMLPRLLDAAPRLKVLVTSRALLRLRVEREYAVPPLGLPTGQSPLPAAELERYGAVALFVERAREVRRGFALTEENGGAVAEICRRLDGLPLAIELAAARLKLLSAQALLARLEDRLKLLTGGARDLPQRQQTMRDAIAWSYDLLEDGEKLAFERLSVFAGGFTLEAGEQVASCELRVASPEGNPDSDLTTYTSRSAQLATLDVLTSLVEKSLLRQEEGMGGEPRFRMLEVVREYARERLQARGVARDAERRHAELFLELAREAWKGTTESARTPEWLGRLEEEGGNLKAALAWWLEHDVEACLRLASSLDSYWNVRGHYREGRAWIEAALGRSSAGSPVPDRARSKALHMLSSLACEQGDYTAARAFAAERLPLVRAAGDERNVAWTMIDFGVVAHRQGDNAAARSAFEEALTVARKLGDKRLTACALTSLGQAARSDGEYAVARSFNEEALALFKEIKEMAAIGVSLDNLGAVAYLEGDFAASTSYYTAALEAYRELGFKNGISTALDGLAALAMKRGELERAARLAGAAEALRESLGAVLDAADQAFRDGYVAELRESLGEEALARALAAGRELAPEQAVSDALDGAPEA